MNKTYSFEEALKQIEKDINNLGADVIERAKIGIQTVAAQAHALIVQKTEKLGSRRDMYIQNLVLTSGGDNIWIVGLKKEAAHLEDGAPQRDMLPGLVNGPKARMSKDGHKYNIIPFSHKKGQSKSRVQVQLANYVQAELKKMKLDKTIKKDGQPVLGKAATVNLVGPGAPMSKHGTPLLAGLTIYQREFKNAKGETKIQRDIMTFRVASEKQQGQGKWIYPEIKGLNAFKEVEREIDKIWEDMIKDILGV